MNFAAKIQLLKIESIKGKRIFPQIPQINADFFLRKSASSAGEYFSYFRAVKNSPL